LGVPISADTTRAVPARAALEAGAGIINDVSGLTADREMAKLVARTGAGLILVASPTAGVGARPPGRDASRISAVPTPPVPEQVVLSCLEERLTRARKAGVDARRIVVDPGIGFFREQGQPWHEWDCRVLARLEALRCLGRPVCVGVSRKSFIGAILGQEAPGHRLLGSLAATAVAALNGAHVIRTHDVTETLEAVRIAEAIRNAT
ncbi:MAG: dihydropteroate synthase, partial [Candidatus Methylomirabilia bacterium]